MAKTGMHSPSNDYKPPEGTGDIPVAVENRLTPRKFPGPWRVEPNEGGNFVIKDALAIGAE
jgi:hypothetical protein